MRARRAAHWAARCVPLWTGCAAIAQVIALIAAGERAALPYVWLATIIFLSVALFFRQRQVDVQRQVLSEMSRALTDRVLGTARHAADRRWPGNGRLPPRHQG